MQDKVNNIMQRMRIRSWREEVLDLSEKDWEFFENTAGALLKAGWTENDIVAFLKCTEEFNPELDEETALERMALITCRYR